MSEEQELDKLDAPIRKRGGPFTPEQRARKQARFLKAMGEHGTVKYACQYAGISRQTFKNWRDNDEAFKAQLPDAELERNDTLEHAAHVQAVDGVPSYVVSQGKIVYHETPKLNEDGMPELDKHGNPVMKRGNPIIERKYAPNLLITLLKANMPNKYKERSSVDVHATVTVDDRNQMLASMNDSELDQLESLVHVTQERLQRGS